MGHTSMQTDATSKRNKTSIEEMSSYMQTGGVLSAKRISIFVQLLNGETITVDTHDDATVEQLQNITTRRVGLMKGTLSLLKEDETVLEAGMTLEEAGVTDKAVLCAIIDEARCTRSELITFLIQKSAEVGKRLTHSEAEDYIGGKQGPFTKDAQDEEWRRLQNAYADPYNCCFDDPTQEYGIPTSMM